MILYQIVFGLLLAEMAALLLLVTPMPLSIHKAIITFVARRNVFGRLIYTFRMIFGIVVLMFCDSINRMIKTRHEYQAEKGSTSEGGASHHHHMTETADCYIRSRMFYAQRNVYLTGFCLFLSLLLHRFFTILVGVYTKDNSAQPPTIPGATAAANSKKSDTVSKEPGNVKSADVSSDSQNAVAKAKTELDIVKRQAQQNANEYIRLQDQYSELENKYNALLDSQRAPSGSNDLSATSSAREGRTEQSMSRKTK